MTLKTKNVRGICIEPFYAIDFVIISLKYTYNCQMHYESLMLITKQKICYRYTNEKEKKKSKHTITKEKNNQLTNTAKEEAF